jgi:hypothetical protein
MTSQEPDNNQPRLNIEPMEVPRRDRLFDLDSVPPELQEQLNEIQQTMIRGMQENVRILEGLERNQDGSLTLDYGGAELPIIQSTNYRSVNTNRSRSSQPHWSQTPQSGGPSFLDPNDGLIKKYIGDIPKTIEDKCRENHRSRMSLLDRIDRYSPRTTPFLCASDDLNHLLFCVPICHRNTLTSLFRNNTNCVSSVSGSNYDIAEELLSQRYDIDGLVDVAIRSEHNQECLGYLSSNNQAPILTGDQRPMPDTMEITFLEQVLRLSNSIFSKYSINLDVYCHPFLDILRISNKVCFNVDLSGVYLLREDKGIDEDLVSQAYHINVLSSLDPAFEFTHNRTDSLPRMNLEDIRNARNLNCKIELEEITRPTRTIDI